MTPSSGSMLRLTCFQVAAQSFAAYRLDLCPNHFLQKTQRLWLIPVDEDELQLGLLLLVQDNRHFGHDPLTSSSLPRDRHAIHRK